MNMHDNSQTNDEEQLVAYLDGELNAEEADAVERRLGQDEAFRSLLARMQSTWDILDELPQPTLDENFTQTTVEMIAVKLSETAATEAVSLQRRQTSKNMGLLLGIGLCVAVGFFLVRNVQSRTDRELLNDLPVIEKIDEYTEVEDLEFLLALYENGLFLDEGLGDNPAENAPSSPPN